MKIEEIRDVLEQKGNINVDIDTIYLEDGVYYYAANQTSRDAVFGWYNDEETRSEVEVFQMFA